MLGRFGTEGVINLFDYFLPCLRVRQMQQRRRDVCQSSQKKLGLNRARFCTKSFQNDKADVSGLGDCISDDDVDTPESECSSMCAVSREGCSSVG